MTLIEVLCALFIVSLSISVAFQNSNLFISTIERSDKQSLAQECATKFIANATVRPWDFDESGVKECNAIFKNHFEANNPNKYLLKIHYKQTTTAIPGLLQLDLHVEENSIILFRQRRLWSDTLS